MATVSVSCPAGGGCSYKTENLPVSEAMVLLQMHERTAHGTRLGGDTVSGKPEKFPRPSIGLDEPVERWEDFKSAWDQYKDEYTLTGQRLTRQLVACCSSELSTSLSRATGGKHFSLTEATLLERMKELVVRFENPAVQVQTFLAINQQSDEGVRHFLSRLKGVATHCNFVARCTCGEPVSYADHVIRFKLVSGLMDEEIKEDILAAGELDLESTVKQIESKEGAKKAKNSLSGNGTNSGQVSKVDDSPRRKPCSHCGRQDHGSSPKERERSCPAFDKKCDTCGRVGHFRKKCLSRKNKEDAGKRSAGVVEKEDEVEVDSVSAGELAGLMYVMAEVAMTAAKASKVKVPHMLFDQLRWIKKSPPSHPMLTVGVSVATDGYKEVGAMVPPATRRRSADMKALADTGCQACCIGERQLNKLGLIKGDLLQPVLSLKAANATGIVILGATFIKVEGRSSSGVVVSTRQTCYVVQGLDHLLLSRDACEKLGIIPGDFPSINSCTPRSEPAQPGGEGSTIVMEVVAPPDRGHPSLPSPCNPRPDGSCSCPLREAPPDPPAFDPNLTEEGLKSLIIAHYASSSFNRCTRQPLPRMKGAPMPIITDPEAVPLVAHTPIQVPTHWTEQVKADLDRDVSLGIIEPVPLNTPSKWCARMVVVPKHDGSPRRTVDFRALNSASRRQTHHTQSPFILASKVPANMKKSTLDVWNAYHCVPIREEDKEKLTFITQWGRFRYCSAPQGYLASGDGYTHRDYLISQGIKNKVTLVDDSLLWDKGIKENFYSVCNMLQTYGKAGLVFNSDKFQFAQDVVQFAGLEVTLDGVRPAREFLEAINKLPTPTCISDIRSFFGMVNQVNYAFSMSQIMEPFRHLLKPGNAFVWSPLMQDLFMMAKQEITKTVRAGVKHFEVDRPTCVSTDWSKGGIGYTLRQKWCKCAGLKPDCCAEGWKLNLMGGRFTTPSESRYSPVEGESLAVAEALHKLKYYVLGCPTLIVATDHKPLIGVFKSQLSDIHNPRLLSIVERTLWFKFSVIHVPGIYNSGPDCLSRRKYEGTGVLSMVYDATEPAIGEVPIVSCVIAAMSSEEGLQAITFQRVKEETDKDGYLTILREFISSDDGAGEMPDGLEIYNRYRDRLSVLDGCLMYDRRVVVPESLREEVLKGLHAAHQGVVSMSNRAQQAVFWPGIFKDLEVTRAKCRECCTKAPSQPALPPARLASPEYPFQMIAADYCSLKGKTWLIVVDRFTGWISVYYFPQEASARKLVETMRETFLTFGVPCEISTDCGVQYTSHEFTSFLQQWGIYHRKSSEYNAHSNLRAETAVKSAKRILSANTRSDGSPLWNQISKALLQHRNTPVHDIALSPAQLLFGRPIRDHLPIRPGLFNPSEVWVTNREQRELALRHRVFRDHERWAEHTRPLLGLDQGEHVFIQNQKGVGKAIKRWDRTGVVLENEGNDKYMIKVDGSGRIVHRNRRYLRKFKPMESSQPAHNPHFHDVTRYSPTQSQRVVPQVRVGDEVGGGEREIITHPCETLSDLLPTPIVQTQPLQESQPTEATLVPPSPPAVAVNNPPKPPPVMEPGEAAAPVRRSGRVSKPNSKYSPGEYDLSQV